MGICFSPWLHGGFDNVFVSIIFLSSNHQKILKVIYLRVVFETNPIKHRIMVRVAK